MTFPSPSPSSSSSTTLLYRAVRFMSTMHGKTTTTMTQQSFFVRNFPSILLATCCLSTYAGFKSMNILRHRSEQDDIRKQMNSIHHQQQHLRLQRMTSTASFRHHNHQPIKRFETTISSS